MLKFAFLVGGMALFAALLLAFGQSVINEEAHAAATLAGGLFTIPLAAAVRP